MSLIVLDIKLTEKSIFKELGLFIDGSLQGFSFCPPKTFKPNKQTTWNTRHLHEIAWGSGKLEFEKLFAVFYQFRSPADIATAGRHQGLSTIYIKHNLFHKSKLGRDVELQNIHIVLFRSSRDEMQVTTLSTQLGLGSGLADWYLDALSVPYGHLLIDLSPRTDDRLRYCTNSGSVPSKFYIPERSKH